MRPGQAASALRGLAGLLFAIAAAGRAAWAQAVRSDARVEIGVANIEQPGTHARSALLLGGVRHRADTVSAALLAVNVTWTRDSVAAVQAIGALAWRPSAGSAWELEGGISGAAFALSALGREGNGSGWVRGRRRLTARTGLLAGAAAGHTIRGTRSSPSVSADVGVWMRAGRVTAEFGAHRLRTRDSLLMAASRIYTRRPSSWLDADDLALSVQWSAGAVDFGVTQRWRTGTRGTDASQGALSTTASWAVSPRVALVANVGRQLADPVRGAPDATTIVALVRITRASSDTVRPLPESDASIARVADGATLIVRIRAPITARVEVAGTFSGWDPVPLVLKGGVWEAQVSLYPGRHRVAYRIDGGPWRAPRGTAPLREFGGEVGLIVVP